MPKELERKLKKQYGKKSDIPYKIMNDMGVMRGPKGTMKGEMMERKHKMQMQMEAVKRLRSKHKKK